MSIREHWECPYCSKSCTLGEMDIHFIQDVTWLAQDIGHLKGNYKIYVCPNKECRKLTIRGHIWESNQNHETGKKLYEWQLVPEANAKPFPDYIPQQLRDDYFESCLIREKSPKASATLSRRCLQGIIRDFWGVKAKNLYEEIAALEDELDAVTWEAIDSVRKVGNIGAHMEANVNLIVDVDPDEASLLIWLIETLFEEWYIERHLREDKMKKIAAMAKLKKAAIDEGKNNPPLGGS